MKLSYLKIAEDWTRLADEIDGENSRSDAAVSGLP